LSAQDRGALVAAALRGAWREGPPAPTLDAHALEAISPLLLDAGCGGLAWWCIRGSGVGDSPAGEQLRDAYRLHALQAAVHERELVKVVRALAAFGVEPLIVKGWAAARLYAQPELRPSGDIDVCVASEQLGAAQAALAEAAPTVHVDLQAGLSVNQRVLPDLPHFEEALARAVHVRLADVDVPIAAPEDHLALLCVHLLSHGGWRPLWLCDIAASVEHLPDGFDWGRCLARSRRLATWVGATLTLAERLLGAQPTNAPGDHAGMPRWLEPAILKQWGSPRTAYPDDLIGLPAAAYFRPALAVRVVRAHWVNPVSATMFPGAAFNSLPRLPFQLRFVAWKAARFLRRGFSDARRLG